MRRSGVLQFIDTRRASLNSHYVNHSVRRFRPPSSRRISSACFGPSRLRMRHIIRPRVVAPAIQSAPYAADSVATIAHLAFSLAATILIPDCPRPSDFRLRSSRNSRRLLFTVAGVVGPDLPHGELPSLQLTTQPLLHRLGAQRYGAAGAGRGHAIQSGTERCWRPSGIPRSDATYGRRCCPTRRTTRPTSRQSAAACSTYSTAPNGRRCNEPGAVAAGGRAPWFVHRAVGVRH